MEQAIQVSPIPSEDEMSTIRQTFERAANAIVDASRLATEVAELRKVVDALRVEIEHVRDQNRWLDEQLHDVRAKRDSLQSDVNALQETKARLEREAEDRNRSYANLETAHNQVRKDRDDHAYRVMELEEDRTRLNAENTRLRTKLAEIAKHLSDLSPAQEVQAQPEPDQRASNW